MNRLASITAVLLLAAATTAQDRENDPRYVPDPTDIPDPRSSTDPRTTTDPTELLTGYELFDDLLARGDLGELANQLGRNPWLVLPYIEDEVNRVLERRESGAATTVNGTLEVEQSEERARLLARMADQVMRDSRFVLHVDNALSWDTEQIAEHRRRQVALGEAARIYDSILAREDALQALTPLEDSLRDARQLGDVVGQARTLAMQGRVQATLGQVEEARSTMSEAVRLGHTVRDFESVWDGTVILYQADFLRIKPDRAEGHLRNLLAMAQASEDEDAIERVQEAFAAVNRLRPESTRKVVVPQKPIRTTSVRARRTRPIWEMPRPRPVWDYGPRR